MNQKYPKHEKLKNTKQIERLFAQGQTCKVFPFKLIYLATDIEDSRIKFGVSVSKRNFKNAVDRNEIKRKMRECYRLHKEPLLEAIQKPHFCMLIYIGREKKTYEEMKTSYLKLIQKITS